MAIRLSKIALVASIGLLALIIVINNVTDYDANFRYIYHVLTMDTVFPDSQLTWRAIRGAWSAAVGLRHHHWDRKVRSHYSAFQVQSVFLLS